jgi:hypothetical protein
LNGFLAVVKHFKNELEQIFASVLLCQLQLAPVAVKFPQENNKSLSCNESSSMERTTHYTIYLFSVC